MEVDIVFVFTFIPLMVLFCVFADASPMPDPKKKSQKRNTSAAGRSWASSENYKAPR
jgi:hypothetical protein